MDIPYPPVNNDSKYFPFRAIDNGGDIVAIGGNLTSELVISFYLRGIFPWYNSDTSPILWYSPNPRCILYPENLHIGKTFSKFLKKAPPWELKLDYAFQEMIRLCASHPRSGQSETWITANMQKVYIELHKMGLAHSCEVYKDSKLIGGFYGICLGKIFFGESMISLEPQVSKYAFIKFVQYFRRLKLELIDCQQKTQHLLSMGAVDVTRNQFLDYIDKWGLPNVWQGHWGEIFCDFH